MAVQRETRALLGRNQHLLTYVKANLIREYAYERAKEGGEKARI